METFMHAFERVATKYAQYIEAKLVFSARQAMQVDKSGKVDFLKNPEEMAERYVLEMKILDKLAQTFKKPEEDVIELGLEELEKLQPTEAEVEEFNRKTVCFMERNEETGAVEITPGNGEKIILNDAGQIKVFLGIVGNYLKEADEPEERRAEDGGRG